MNKEFKNIDELYRAEMADIPTAVPDFVKKNIDSALGFNRRKQLGFFLLFSVLLLTGLVAAIMVPHHNLQNTSARVESADIVAGARSTTQNRFQPYVTKNGISSNENAALNQPTTASSTLINHEKGNDLTVQSASVNTQRKIDKRSTKKNELVTDQRQPNGDTNTKEGQTINTGLAAGNGGDGTEITISNEKSSLNGAALNPTELNKNEAGNNNNPISNNKTAENQDVAENTKSDPLKNIQNQPENGSLPQLDLSELPAADEDEENGDTAKNKQPALPQTTINPSEKSTYKPFMFSLTSGINRLKSAYTSPSMTEKSIYDNATTDRLGNETNLDVTYRLKNGLALGTGIGLVNYIEDYNFKVINITYDTIETYDFTYDSVGAIIDTIINYTPVQNENSVNYTGTNKASYFILPVSLGAQMQWKKFQFDIFASVRFNFLMRSSGGYLLNENVQTFDQSNTIYKRNYIDLMLGTKVHYNFWKNLYLSGSIQYRPVVGSILTHVPFNKSFDYLHIGLGLSLKL